MAEKREILLRNGAKFIIEGELKMPGPSYARLIHGLQNCPKRVILSTPEGKNSHFRRVLEEKTGET